MRTILKRLGVAALTGAAVLAAGQSARAQFGRPFVPTTLNQQQVAVNPFFAANVNARAFAIRNLGQALSFVPPAAFGFNPFPQVVGAAPFATPFGPFAGNPYLGGSATLTSQPFGGSPGFNNFYGSGGYGGFNPYIPYYDPFSGYLQGGASVINAQGQFAINFQQARLVQQQVEQAKIDTRRRQFDEWKYFRDNTPTLNDRIRETAQQELDRARFQPPVTEVWSGKALNDLYSHIAPLESRNVRAQSIGIDPDVLKKINLTDKWGGNIGLVRNKGQLSWPLVLKGSDYDTERKRVEELIQGAADAARFNNRVDAGAMKDLDANRRIMEKRLQQQVSDLPPSQHIEAKRYLRHLHEAYIALEQPNVSNFFAKWAPQGKDVAELVKFMKDNGLTFAPAVPGDEAAYQALHSALSAYDSLLTQVAQK